MLIFSMKKSYISSGGADQMILETTSSLLRTRFHLSVLWVLSPISSFETTACVLSGPVTTTDANHVPHFHNHSDVEHEVGQARQGKVITGEWVNVC